MNKSLVTGILLALLLVGCIKIENPKPVENNSIYLLQLNISEENVRECINYESAAGIIPQPITVLNCFEAGEVDPEPLCFIRVQDNPVETKFRMTINCFKQSCQTNNLYLLSVDGKRYCIDEPSCNKLNRTIKNETCTVVE